MEMFNPLIEVKDDGLLTPEVRTWSLEKYRLLGHYCQIFTNGMKNKWDQLVYIDLFAGAGNAKIIENNKIYLSSPLIAMSLPVPFTKYIFCERNVNKYESLKSRVKSNFSHLDYSILNRDSNLAIEEIKELIPNFNRNNTMLSFCFVDPCSLNLHFNTIKSLGSINMDFLILQALHMDANRNIENYLSQNSDKIDLYLDNANWRKEYNKYSNQNFVQFLANHYENSMTKIGYQKERNFNQIRSNLKNLPLYYLSFYSKNKRGIDFFKKIQMKANEQLRLDF